MAKFERKKRMKYYIFRRKLGYKHDYFWEFCDELCDISKEELEDYLRRYSNEHYMVIHGKRKYVIATQFKVV